MNKQILKICPTLGEYHEMTEPDVISVRDYSEFYKQHKEIIENEGTFYSRIVNARNKLGGDKKIHSI